MSKMQVVYFVMFWDDIVLSYLLIVICSHIIESYLFCIGKFYRAEKQLLLQGIISEGPRNKVVLGPCPNPDYKPKSKCPSHDPNCGCHGPIMTKGMVGWAGGGGGPDFFINTFVSV